MMESSSAVDKKKLQLLEKRKRIDMQEKLIKIAEKKKRMKLLEGVGKLAFDANIDQIERQALLGAFLEISRLASEESKIEQWKILAEEFYSEKKSTEHKNEKTALVVSFKTPPSKEIKETLKNLKFRWNSFRKEYHGHGKKEEISELLKSFEVKIEVISNV